VAVVRDGQLVYLENGRTREEVIAAVAASVHEHREVVVGFDFAFSFPAWFVHERGLRDVGSLWDLVGAVGEEWLAECRPPFWGRAGAKKPVLREHLRETDKACDPVSGITPKSVFQIGGAGAVGTASIRGMPYLGRLRQAGFSIWPFDPPRLPLVVEIYPRALTGEVNKSDALARREYLKHWALSPPLRLRDELLNVEEFADLRQAQVIVEDWRIEYNTYRPHSALGGLTPDQYAKTWAQQHQPTLPQ